MVQPVLLTQTPPELPAATVKEYAATADDRRLAISKSLEHAVETKEPLLPDADVLSLRLQPSSEVQMLVNDARPADRICRR